MKVNQLQYNASYEVINCINNFEEAEAQLVLAFGSI
jgi:hypothetical protein